MIALYCRKNHRIKTAFVSIVQILSAMQSSELINVHLWKQRHFVQIARCIVISLRCERKFCVVMRFSGPRMLLYHPVMALHHVIETKKEKRRLKNYNEN